MATYVSPRVLAAAAGVEGQGRAAGVEQLHGRLQRTALSLGIDGCRQPVAGVQGDGVAIDLGGGGQGAGHLGDRPVAEGERQGVGQQVVAGGGSLFQPLQARQPIDPRPAHGGVVWPAEQVGKRCQQMGTGMLNLAFVGVFLHSPDVPARAIPRWRSH